MAVRNSIYAIPLTSLPAAGFNGTFQLMNVTGFPQACFIVRIINDSTEDIIVSYDGVNDHDVVINQTTLQIESQTNSQPNNFICKFPIGQKVWILGAPGAGAVYLAGYYQLNAN